MYKYWITVLGAWLICLSSFATEEPTVMKSLRGSEGQLKPDSTAAIRDTSFYEDLSRSPRKFTDISNKNIITFTLDEGSPLYLKTPFSATLTFQLYYSFKNTPAAEDSLSEYQTLVINYDTASANPYTMRSYFEFDDAVSVRLKIISISTTASGWDPLPALIVTNEMRRERIFTFDCEANKVQQILFTAPPAGADELQVYWNQSEGADEYDLEWAYIDQQAYASQLYGDPGSPGFTRNLFRNNSSRVTLKNTESGYKIPLLYENNGKLFFRVRAVQVTPSGKRTETNWSDYNSFDFVAGHQSNLNWQSVTSFAEEGKRKSVVQYFDGSLRSRQTVTKDNTTGTTVVAENFYDYQGRPVIQVLPSPTINSVIQHTPAFNQFLNTGAYYKDNYDKIISGNDLCSGAAPGLDAAKGGAAQYYSPQNPEKNIENNHLIPDAEGFPYSETRYMRDNTGRIAAQGGVGKEHRINQGHDTKYYYGTPEQNELDALFGTEAGDASHYFKNMVRDANGQYSVSYLDMHGRTVATALAGELPPGMKLDYLPSKENREITSSLINASNNIIKGLVIESSKTLVVPLKANYKFRYSLLPENVNIENCSKEDICYSCSYDLEITISDDCGNGQFGGTPYVFTSTIGSISEDCNDLPSLFTKEIPKTLEEGSYVITKKLTIRDTAIAVHSAAFMENNLCKTIQDFVDEQMTIFLEQTNNCTTPCGACMLQLGESQQAFITKFISDNGLDPNSEKSTKLAQDMYQHLSAQCSELCGGSPRETYLDQLRRMMLMDVTPSGGQYADPNDFNPDVYPRTYYKYSIFGPISQNNSNPRYTINSISYKDSDGKPSLVTVNRAGVMLTLRPQELTIDEFVTYFQPSWAEALMKNLHPEYAGYQIMETEPAVDNQPAVGRENDNWDWEFRHTETFAEALSRGYLNPTSNNAFVKRNPTQTREFIKRDALTDPFFLRHPYLKTQMESFMVNVASGAGEALDIWAASSVSAFCKDEHDLSCLSSQKSDPFTVSACDADLDMAWRAFRALYISRKEDIIRTMIRSNAGLPALQDPSGTRTYHSYFGDISATIKNNTGISNLNNKAEVEAALEDFYQGGNTCTQYAELWWSRLAPCGLEKLKDHKAAILADLIAVCQKGTDKDHIMGASSIAPGAVNTYKDFDEVLAHYVQVYNQAHPGSPISLLDCNASLLDFPQPYAQPQVVADKPVLLRPDDCECDKINQLREAYEAEGQDADFAAYILRRYQYQVSQSDLDELESRCNQSASECRFLSRPIMLPPVFQCNEGNLCATCEMVADAYNDFKNHYPQYTPAVDESGDEQQGKINQLFSHYMNQQLGLSRQTIEYLAFMDSCGLSEADLNCKNLNQLQKQYNRDVNPYRFESFLQSNHLNLDQNVIRDWNTIISDGMLRWPQEIRDTTTRDWVYFQHMTRNSAGNKFCIQNGYSIEWSFRSLKNVLKENDDVFYFQDNNVHFTVSKRGIVNPGIYLREIKESAAEFPSPVVLFSGSILLNSDPEIIYKKWSTIKLSVTPADIAIYFDGQLVKKVAKTSTSDTLRPEGAFTLAFFDYQGALDWIKMYDADGNVTVHEDYNDPSTRAVIHPSFLCPQPGGDCKDLFTNFFNQKQGTSYSYEEIESLYLTTCGERLDVCGSLQYKKENLIDAVDGYYLNSVPGLVKHKIQSEATVLSNNPVELFRDGLLQLPESFQGPGQWYYGYQIDFKKLCTQNGFAIEHRFKLGNPELSGNLFYTGHRAVQAVFSYYPNGSGGNLPGLYIENIDLYGYDGAPVFRVPGSWLIKEGDDFRNMWLAVKTVVRPNKVEIHLNNQKIWEYDRDPAIPINQYQNFGLYPRGTKSKYDYIKIWDSDDNLVYYEDFNNGHRPAVIKSDFICVTQQDCKTAFRNYFNERFGTNYGDQEIEQLYYEQQVPLNICVGDPDFQEIETLEQIEKDFNMNLNPYRVRVDCQSNPLTPSIINDLNEIFTDGKIHWPDRIRDSLTGYFTYFVPRRSGNYWEKGYGTEFRFKFRKEKMRKDEEFFFASDANQALVLYRRSTAHPTVSTGISFNLREEGVYHAVDDPDIIFNEWNTVKYEILPTEKRFYYNGNLIVTLPNNKPIKNGVNQFNFMTYEAEMDCVKWYDGEGRLVGEDNFDVTDTRPVMEPDYFVGNYGTDCQAQFTKYYNEQRGTQLNFEQIDEIYFNTLGKHLDICGKKIEVNSDHRPEYSKIYTRSGYQEKPLDMLDIGNGQIIVGRSETADGNKTVGLAVYLDADGKVTWSKQLGDKNFTSVSRIIHAGNQEFILAGTTDQFGGSLQPFVAKINNEGTILWSVSLPLTGMDFEETLDITPVSSGNYAIAVRGETKVVVMLINASGNVIWEKTYQSDDLDKAEILPDYRSISLFEEGDSLAVFTTAIPVPENKGNSIWCMKVNIADGVASDSRIMSIDHPSSIYHFRGMQVVQIPKGYLISAMYNMENGLNKILRTAEFYLNKRLERISANVTSPTLTGKPVLNPLKVMGGDSDGNIYKAQLDAEDGLNFEHFYRGYKTWGRRYLNMAGQPYLINGNAATNRYTLAGQAKNESGFFIFSTVPHAEPVCDNEPLQDFVFGAARHVLFSRTVQVSNLSGSGSSVTMPVSHYMLTVKNHCAEAPSPSSPLLCNTPTANRIVMDVPEDSPCADSTRFSISRGYERYSVYTDSLRGEFTNSYIAKCLQAAAHESFTVTHAVSEYHYTLYYYDQAGNLIKTVPPNGVQPKYGADWSQRVAAARQSRTVLVPGHSMATQYRYNTLNQVVEQRSPDAGKSEFWYDRLGRLVLSQNAKQALSNGTEGPGVRMSYTLYDHLSRITEVGQISNASPAMTNAISRDPQQLQNWLSSNLPRRQQVILTVYDQGAKDSYLHKDLSPYILQQRGNLRNRVSFSLFSKSGDISNYDYAAFYNYDIHGNVDTLLHDYGAAGIMAANGGRYKRIAYGYDLISGKVNSVSYQPQLYDPVTKKYITQPDAFYHRYAYDAENRLTDVYTGSDEQYWEHDAHYRYYKHGPLARMTLGDQRVQGLDYAYTLQGWLKGVNGTAVGTGAFDAGHDGMSGAAHHDVARDAFGFSLQYYGNDYTPILNNNSFADITAGFGANAKPLYNGNISSMAVNIPKLGNALVYAYTYDQLNRLTAMDAWGGLNNANNQFTPISLNGAYQERITYDPNGNILTYKRNGDKAGAQQRMDELTYNYKNNNNQLKRVRDAAADGNYSEDIDDQPADNYAYDAIGNLIQDTKEGITKISWTVYGKIESIEKSDGTTIDYSYDATGNRISKTVTKGAATTTTAYVRDAQGNVMSVYNADASINSGHFTQSELHLYGSSRLGIYNLNKDLTVTSAAPVNMGSGNSGILNNFERNKKLFELTNHLGNVLATVSDEKIGMDVAPQDGIIDYYTADVVSAQDYYPFGMAMPGRKFSSERYRYGFNGKENDKDISPGAQDYGMRISDNRLGRFLSVDPISKSYPMLTPYQFASNRPIDGIDLDGAEYIHYYVFLNKQGAFIMKHMAEDFRNRSEVEMNKMHGTTDFYKQYSAGFGPLGRKVQYTYFKEGDDGTFTAMNNSGGSISTEVTQEGGFFSRLSRHGLYYGAGSITTKGPLFYPAKPGVGDYDFSYKPIDMVDAAGKAHDMEEDNTGFIGWRHPQNTAADIRFVRRLEAYYEKALYDENYVDPYNGRKPSEEAIQAASNAINLFTWEINSKKKDMEKMLKNGKITEAQYNKWQQDIKKAETETVVLPKPNPSDK